MPTRRNAWIPYVVPDWNVLVNLVHDSMTFRSDCRPLDFHSRAFRPRSFVSEARSRAMTRPFSGGEGRKGTAAHFLRVHWILPSIPIFANTRATRRPRNVMSRKSIDHRSPAIAFRRASLVYAAFFILILSRPRWQC